MPNINNMIISLCLDNMLHFWECVGQFYLCFPHIHFTWAAHSVILTAKYIWQPIISTTLKKYFIFPRH